MPLALGLVHVALVAPHYFVGSFDDDAGYILSAHALLTGGGLTAPLSAGTETVIGTYPPGYPALLVPLLWLWPHSFVPLRLLSVACYAALFPLTWMWLGRRHVGDVVRGAVLGLLALGPTLATFASMVMAEAPFLVALMVLFLVVERWEAGGRVWTGNGVAVLVLAPALVWLKEAGIGAVAGLILWLLARGAARRRGGGWWRQGTAVALSTGLLLSPVVIARAVSGSPLLGDVYAGQLAGYFHGGLVDRLVDVVPHSLVTLFSSALPLTLVPYRAPLPDGSAFAVVWQVLYLVLSALVVVGAVVSFRRHRDAAVAVVPVYLGQILLYPFINERRTILVVPVLCAWAVLGAHAVWELVDARLPLPWHPAASRVAVAGVVAVAVVAPLVAQMPRDYLLGWGQDSSRFAGSRYVAILARLGSPSDLVETDYLRSTTLFSGHATGNEAFVMTYRSNYSRASCSLSAVRRGIAADRAAFLLLGDLNKPHVMDSPCVLRYASSATWAVRLLHTARDDASVYELLGPGTGHPDLRDLTAGAVPSEAPGVLEWDWGHPETLSQVSAGQVTVASATVSSVALQLRFPDGLWRTVADAPAAVGDGSGDAPYLLATLPQGTIATAFRLVVSATGQTGRIVATDVHAIGPAASQAQGAATAHGDTP